MRRRSALFALVFSIVSTAAMAQVHLGEPDRSGGGSTVNPGDVYGKATFVISSNDGDVSQLISGLAEALIQSQYNNNDGSYLLTLELTQNQKSLGIVPLVTIEFHNKSFLFFNVSKTISQGVDFDGTIVTTGPVDQSNNDVSVSLKSYYNANSSFDLSLLDELIQYNKQYTVLAKLDPTGAIGSVVSVFDDILGKALQKATKSTELFNFQMGFANVAGATPTRIVNVPISFAGNNSQGSLNVLVKTWSESSRYQFDPETRKFLNASPITIFANTGIPISSGSVDILQYLQKNGDDPTKQFLTSLLGPSGYTGQNITGECTNLILEYRKFLSNRDALALLWATISSYRSNFKAAKAAPCVEQWQAEFQQLGLPTAQLLTALQ